MKPLRVWGVGLEGIYRGVVAARSRASAARSLGVRDSYLKEYGSETGNKEEIEMAKSREGIPFRHTNWMSDWEWKINQVWQKIPPEGA